MKVYTLFMFDIKSYVSNQYLGLLNFGLAIFSLISCTVCTSGSK